MTCILENVNSELSFYEATTILNSNLKIQGK